MSCISSYVEPHYCIPPQNPYIHFEKLDLLCGPNVAQMFYPDPALALALALGYFVVCIF